MKNWRTVEMENPNVFRKLTICDSCPCLNNDFEQGTQCNVGYTTDLFWMDGGKLIDASPDCGLEYIKHSNGIFKKPLLVMARKTRTDGK